MTEIAREFLEDVNVGDHIKVRYGTDNNQETAEGIVESITENFLKLKRKDGGTSKIRLDDSLRSLDVIVSAPELTNTNQEIINKHVDTPKPNPQIVIEESKPKFKILRYFVLLEPAQSYEFIIKEQIKDIKDTMKKVENKILLSELNSVLNSLDSAIKNNQVEYKYHDLRAKILRTWDICNADEDYELFYLFTGVLAVVAKDYDYALEPLIRAQKYSLASYAASMKHRSSDTEVFKFCSLLSKQERTIDSYVAETCINRRDVEVLQELLEANKDDADICEKIASCAKMLFTSSNGELSADIDEGLSAYDTTKQLLEAVPEDWKKHSEILERWQEYQQYTYPEHQDTNSYQAGSQLVGKIYRYENAIGKNWIHLTRSLFLHQASLR